MFNLLEIGPPAPDDIQAPPLDTEAPNNLPSTQQRQDAAEKAAGTLVEPMPQSQRTALVWLGVAALALGVWLYTSGGEG